MGSIGTGEILIILLIALLIFGPNKLPDLGKAVGRALREFKKAETEIKNAVTEGTSSLKKDTADIIDAYDEALKSKGTGEPEDDNPSSGEREDE